MGQSLHSLPKTPADAGVCTYVTVGGSTVSLPVTIDNHIKLEKPEFRRRIIHPSRQMRAELSLKYDFSSRKEVSQSSRRYRSKDGRHYHFDTTSPFTLAVMGNTRALAVKLKASPINLDAVDEFNETLLYKAARSGFVDMTEFLLEKGCSINQASSISGSTPLHASSYFGHKLILAMLLARGADRTIKNLHGNIPLDEGRTPEIKELLRMDNSARQSLENLVQVGVAGCLRPLSRNGKVIGWKVNRHPQLVSGAINAPSIPPEWKVVWHGTRREHLESILRHDLQPGGSELPNGERIRRPSGNLKLDQSFLGIENFADAIFVSPCVAYAAHPCYAERLGASGQEWIVLIEARVRPGSFTKFKSADNGYLALDGNEGTGHASKLPGHPEIPHPYMNDAVEGEGDEVNTIFRVSGGGMFANTVVTGVVLVARSFLETGASNEFVVKLLSED